MMDLKDSGITMEWLALFALAIVAIIILYISSVKMSKVKKMYKEMDKKSKEMEEQQNTFIANMSEDIYEIVEKDLKETTDGDTDSDMQYSDHDDIINKHKLLNVAGDLIEFLRLKSRKIAITNEQFIISNLLNEVAGSIGNSFKGSDIELIFEIDKDIPRNLIGDTLKLEKISRNFLEFMMHKITNENSYIDGEIRLVINMFKKSSNKVELEFKFTDNSIGIENEELSSIFIPTYDENSGEYTGLGLFVAKELIQILNGKLEVQSTVGKGNTFTATLPFETSDTLPDEYKDLPDEVLLPRRVFIVDTNYNSALAIKKMFSTFRYKVDIVSKEDFIKTHYSLENYDIIMLNHKLFTDKVTEYLSAIKADLGLKVIALDSLLNKDTDNDSSYLIDRVLSKPLNQDRISQMLMEVYSENKPKISIEDAIKMEMEAGVQDEHPTRQDTLPVEIDIAATDGVTQDSFVDFDGMSLLIVEDNIINQKVLTNILKTSGITMGIANNGQEAVLMLRKDVKKYELVLMDINMPIMDGYKATEAIRKDEHFDKLPVVAFTALALGSEKRKIFNSGMNAFLTKPIELGKLYTAFKTFYADANIGRSKHRAKSVERVVKETDILDTKSGIEYSDSNIAFYIEILKEFLDAYGDSDKLFEDLVSNNNLEAIKILCLDIRGLAGSIGAHNLYKLTVEIHRHIINENSKPISIFTEEYKRDFTELKEAIRYYLGQ